MSQENVEEVPKELQTTSRGECQVCLQPDLLKENLDAVRNVQQMKTMEVLKKLRSTYGELPELEVKLNSQESNR